MFNMVSFCNFLQNCIEMKSMQHLEKKYQCIESDKVSGLTVVMDVDTFKNLVKQNHPLLAQLAR